jgi:phage tail-like protein
MARELKTGRQTALDQSTRGTFLFSAVFELWSPRGSAHFAELGGLVSEIEHTEYMETGPFGSFFSRHPGRSKPPSLTLRRTLRTGPSTTWLWLWHQQARHMPVGAKADCFLTITSRGGAVMTYGLMGAWPSKLELSGVKAGGTEMIIQTVTLQCDELVDTAAG